mmetsp:Transcript_43493/g.127995  ORF Transcript_43493/g.127995 Transcript_43493/m.127995 type:complete len:544 (+) Transcript_43493:98-1729(+)
MCAAQANGASAEEEDDIEHQEEQPPSLQLVLWRVFDDPSSGPMAKSWSIFMMIVILYSILNFTLAGIPADLVIMDVWSNRTTGDVIPFTTENDFSGDDEAVFRSDGTHQTAGEHDDYRTYYRQVEVFCICTFTFEFIIRLLCSPAGPGVCNYLKSVSNMVDLLSVMPFYLELVMSIIGVDGADSLGVLQILRLIRLTRISRIFKMSKKFQALIVLWKTIIRSVGALTMLIFFMMIFSVLFATLIYMAEMGDWDEARNQFVREDGSASPFESIPASVWWAIITMATVGYGDDYPVSSWGRVVAVITMTVSLLVLSLPITIIGANFDEEYSEMRARALAEAQTKAETDKARRQALVGKAKKVTHNVMAAQKVSGTKCLSQFAAGTAQAAMEMLVRRGSKIGGSSTTTRSSMSKVPGAVDPRGCRDDGGGSAAGGACATDGDGREIPARHRGEDGAPKQGNGSALIRELTELITRAHADALYEVSDLMKEHELQLRQDIAELLKYVHETGATPALAPPASRRPSHRSVAGSSRKMMAMLSPSPPSR